MKQFTYMDWVRLRIRNYQAFVEQYLLTMGRVSSQQPLSTAEKQLMRVAARG